MSSASNNNSGSQKRSAGEAGLKVFKKNAKQYKSQEPRVYMWPPHDVTFNIDELKLRKSEIKLLPKTADEKGQMVYLHFPIPDEFRKERNIDEVCKYFRTVPLYIPNVTTTTGLTIWKPKDTIKNWSCSINFQLPDTKYWEAFGRVAKPAFAGWFVEYIAEQLAENPLAYFGDAGLYFDEIEDMVARKKAILNGFNKDFIMQPAGEYENKRGEMRPYHSSLKAKVNLREIGEKREPALKIFEYPNVTKHVYHVQKSNGDESDFSHDATLDSENAANTDDAKPKTAVEWIEKHTKGDPAVLILGIRINGSSWSICTRMENYLIREKPQPYVKNENEYIPPNPYLSRVQVPVAPSDSTTTTTVATAAEVEQVEHASESVNNNESSE